MNEPQSITVSLEWAKKLKEAGWPQVTPQNPASLFYWAHFIGLEEPALVYASKVEMIRFDEFEILLSAPTADEILRRLPNDLTLKNEKEGAKSCPLRIGKFEKRWDVRYFLRGTNFLFLDDSLADACAEMWCYLSANKLLP